MGGTAFAAVVSLMTGVQLTSTSLPCRVVYLSCDGTGPVHFSLTDGTASLGALVPSISLPPLQIAVDDASKIICAASVVVSVWGSTLY